MTLEQNRLPVAASYREEERQRRLGPPAHAATSEGDSEMVYSLDKCQRVKSIFSALSFFTRGGKLRAGYVSTHPERSEMKHQTHCRVLVGSSFLWLPLDSWKGTVTCADLARRHLQRGGGLINTLTQNYWVLKVVYANMHLTHMADIIDVSVACALAGMWRSRTTPKLEAAPSCHFFPPDK